MMNVMIVTLEQAVQSDLHQVLSQDTRFQMILFCKDSTIAWKQFLKHQPDAVFLSLGRTKESSDDALRFAEKIRRKSQQTAIVFLSADHSYALEAYKAYPLDFLLVPIQKPRLIRTIDRLFLSHESKRGVALAPRFSRLRIRCFGQYEITEGIHPRDPIHFPSRKCRELIAFLISRYSQTVTRAMLLENLFDGQQDEKTVNQLHVTIYQLRKVLQKQQCVLANERSFTARSRNFSENEHSFCGIAISGQYQAQVDDGICDLVDFTRLTRLHMPIDASNILETERIAALYRGPCFEYEEYPWADELRAELELAHEQLLIRIAAFHESRNQLAQSEQALKTLIHVNPYSEDGNHALMDLYLQKKDQHKFLRQYEAYLVILTEELNASMEPRYQIAYRTLKPS